jgi:dGTPase
MSVVAPYASDPVESRGRLHPTSESSTRSEHQRDRDRIIHSTAFRRLQHKTQVFLRHEGQHYRTRLTHTLEVSQMARSIARALRLNEDLAEAVALAHDLGHPPFGHAGERVLNEKMQPFGGFDHNLQAVRVVTRLENRYAEHDGLNLTWETLEGILKHNGPLAVDPGEIAAVADLMIDTHASLEAQCAAIADDIAYDAHDIDDALRAKILTLHDLVDVPLAGPIVREVLHRWPAIEPNRQAHEVQRRVITRMIEDAITTSEAGIEAAGIRSADDARHAGQSLVRFSDETAVAERGLKRFLYERVYRSEAVMAPVREGETVIAALFDSYMADPDLPGRWAGRVSAAPTAAGRARVICDFIAGMTDPYALEQHARLFDGSPALR